MQSTDTGAGKMPRRGRLQLRMGEKLVAFLIVAAVKSDSVAKLQTAFDVALEGNWFRVRLLSSHFSSLW
jgi:hypothetical protein